MNKSLWAINFTAGTQNGGSGVIMLDGNQVYGGSVNDNSGCCYEGKCDVIGNAITASVTISKQTPYSTSVFGSLPLPFDVLLESTGKPEDQQIVLTGQVKGYPQLTLTASLQKLTNYDLK